MLAILGLMLGVTGGVGLLNWQSAQADPAISPEDYPLVCYSIEVTDGDTFRCDGERIRMHGIDAPEMPGHCREGRDCATGDPYASSENLSGLVAEGNVRCQPIETDAYGRTVARCVAGKTDLSCAQAEGGYAVFRYGSIDC